MPTAGRRHGWRRLRCVWRGSRRDGRYRTAPRLRHLTALVKRDLFDDEPQRQRECDQVVHRSCDRHAPSPLARVAAAERPYAGAVPRARRGKPASSAHVFRVPRSQRPTTVCRARAPCVREHATAPCSVVSAGRPRTKGFATRRGYMGGAGRLAWSGLGATFKSRGECEESRGARECGAGPPHTRPRGYRAPAARSSCRGTRRAGACARPRG
jgi:hypothetical protein